MTIPPDGITPTDGPERPEPGYQVDVTGTIVEGIETGSYVLECDPGAPDRIYQLGAAGQPWCGQRVRVVGTALTEVLTITMQGVPVQAKRIVPLDGAPAAPNGT